MNMKSLALVLGVLAAGSTLAAPVALTQVGNLNCPYYQCGTRIAVSGSYFYTPASCGAAGSCLKVYDLQTPTAPVQVGSVPFIYGSDVIAAGRYLYLPSAGGLQIADLRNPTAPELVSQTAFDGGFRAALSGNYLYVAAVSYSYGPPGLRVVDVTDPAAPASVGFLGMPASARGVAISGTLAYVVDDVGILHVVDVSSPTTPREITQLALGEPAYDIALSGTYGYVVTHGVYCDEEDVCTLSQGHLKVLDLGVPATPSVVSSIGRPKASERIVLSGRYAYLVERSINYYGNDGELTVVDVGNPFAPVDVAYGANHYGVEGVAVAGGYVYVESTWNQFVFNAYASSAPPVCY